MVTRTLLWIHTHQHETDTTGSPDPDVRQLLQKGLWVAHQPWLKWAEVLQNPEVLLQRWE